MKSPDIMTDNQLFKWALKTSRSINASAYRSRGMNHRTLSLIDRYQELREEMLDRGIWNQYCKANGFDENHDGYDAAA